MADVRNSFAANPYSEVAFPLSRHAWETCGLASVFGDRQGGVLSPQRARALASHLITNRRENGEDAGGITAGRVLALDLLHAIFRYMADWYCADQYPRVLETGLRYAVRELSPAVVAHTVEACPQLYPPSAVLRGEARIDEYLERGQAPYTGREVVARELLLLHLALFNRAARPFRFLFDDAELRARAPYEACVAALDRFFLDQPPYPKLGLPLLKALRAPIEAAPDSLEGQLDYVREHWQAFLPAELLAELVLVHDIIREETAMRSWGPGPAQVLRFGAAAGGYPEVEAFSKDIDWMSNVVLMAKSTHVWLHQLSLKYGRDIDRLDQIPDEELDQLGRWGFTGLWLIGLWERSAASQQIKQMTGNPEALSSAYSLYDYEVAQDVGGHGAYENLRDRAWQRGIRLASDMVPNHMGIYSKWVVEHPDWFVGLPYPPYPGYRFTGADLSRDDRVCIQIEDGYWDRTDAAVVFRRLDKWTGDARYIYHGNDGTSTPWNDTAQLNFLLPEVRETVIQTILHVARMFPIIRFDAAMTLAKRHFQRLWFPQPGDAGAIPSRAEHGMSKEAFDAVFPKEFWREVVDRVAQEVPDTLLLAEAFWLMEGYFVRTLGMHRVYNSAFMNMLKMEENSKYRQTVKNVLEFSPEVLKRFVNFMNNPDERTAVEQFGRGDKYCGVALLMVTMPGLPMFGHGQIEGFTEKYGMEYGRAYHDETVDEHLVYRHEVEIFPLMRKRHLFSGVENFTFFDFEMGQGGVDENVFAYSNRAGGERALIAYNNAYNSTSGWIRRSTAINTGSGDAPHLVFRNLAEALALNTEPNHFYVFRDHRSGLEFLREGRDFQDGLYIELGAYQYHAFIDFREVYDHDGSWRDLAAQVNGAGAPDMFEAYRERQLADVLEPLRALINGPRLIALVPDEAALPDDARESACADAGKSLSVFLDAVMHKLTLKAETSAIVEEVRRELAIVQDGTAGLARRTPSRAARGRIVDGLPVASEDRTRFARELAVWALLHRTGAVLWPEDGDRQTGQWMDEWLFRKPVTEAVAGAGADAWMAQQAGRLLKLVLRHDGVLDADGGEAVARLTALFEDDDGQQYLGVNLHEGVVYFNKERFADLLHRCVCCRAVVALGQSGDEPVLSEPALDTAVQRAVALERAAERAGYQVAALLSTLAPQRALPKGAECRTEP